MLRNKLNFLSTDLLFLLSTDFEKDAKVIKVWKE
jgi:hypothetical protein